MLGWIQALGDLRKATVNSRKLCFSIYKIKIASVTAAYRLNKESQNVVAWTNRSLFLFQITG